MSIEKFGILIVDDHPVVLRGLKALLESEPDFVVVGEEAGAATAIRAVEKKLPDIVIVDLTLKDGDGLELLKQIRSRFPLVRTLVSSMHDETLYTGRVIDAGGHGFIGKQASSEELIEAVRTVLEGKIYLSESMREREEFRGPARKRRSTLEGVDLLSDRELQVFELIGRGLSTKEMAEHLMRSPKTIETHRDRIKLKLGIETMQELNRRAFMWVEDEA